MQQALRLGLVMAAVAAVTIALCCRSSESGFTAAITNSINSAGTASTLLTATDTSSSATDCTSVATPISSVQSFPCARSTLPASVAASGVSSSSIGLTSTGTAATMTASACGPVDLINQIAITDPMLVRGGVSYDLAGPLGSASGSLRLDGTTASAEDVTASSGVDLVGASTTQGIWFKTTPSYTGGGTLMGFGSSPSDSGSEAAVDHVLWMNSSGKIGFALQGTLGLGSALVTTASYNDGNWHFVVATVATVAGVSVPALVVDGALVATGLGLTLLTGFTGYWHIGWSPLPATFPGVASNYFAGQVSGAFTVNTTALSGALLTTLTAAGTQTAWNADLISDGASESWNLNDPGTTTYSGPYPVIGTTSPCAEMAVAVGGAGFCIDSPNSLTTACSTPTATSLSCLSWVAAGALSFPPTALAATTTITTTLIRGTTYNTAYLPGLHLYLPVTLTERLGASWYTTFTWTSAAQQATI